LKENGQALPTLGRELSMQITNRGDPDAGTARIIGQFGDLGQTKIRRIN
jgi:hypothetical protein